MLTMNIGMKSILTLSQALITSLSFMTSGYLLGAIDHSFFEMRIRPVLAEKCYECHSARASKIKGGLRLDHIDFIEAGEIRSCPVGWKTRGPDYPSDSLR